MLRVPALACMLSLSLSVCGPAFALEQDSTMADWSAAPASDREALLDRLGPSLTRSFESEKPKIMACIELAGRAPGHADLLVSDIAKACVEAAEEKSPSNDI